jgi:hypothetical protein
MKTYIRFTETNDHEGERWHFYIPLPGNEEAIRRLEALLEEDAYGEFELKKEMFTEPEVDVLVKYSEGGYMMNHNKLEGTLDLKRLQKALDDGEDPLYKGGIKDYLHGQKEGEEAVRHSEEGDGENSDGGSEDGE